jgi:hypothetical protein
MEALVPLIVQLVAGAIGGNVSGMVLKEKSLGTTINSIAGAIGGVIGAYALSGGMAVDPAAVASSGIDLTNIAGGGIGGLILAAVAGVVKNAMNKSA